MKKGAAVYFFSLMAATLLYSIMTILKITRMERVNRLISFMIINMLNDSMLEIRKDYDVPEKKIITKAILAVPSRGCAHYFYKGGCAMCGFNKEIEKYGFQYFHPLAIVTLITICLYFLDYEIQKKNLQIDSLSIFMGGSFLNNDEIPVTAQDLVMDYIKLSGIRRIIIESRPEYILENQTRLRSYAANIGCGRMEIAIGLESADERIRNKLINKNICLNTYETAISVLKKAGILISTYVLIGAPGMSEKQIVESAVSTAAYAWQAGSDIVNLESYCVQKNTPWEKLHYLGKVKPPDLWSIVEVIKKISKNSDKWYLGKFSDWPEPIKVPCSCPKCSENIITALNDLRKVHDLAKLETLSDCGCRLNYA